MEHTAPKLGTALAAAVLGLGLPVAAAAQDVPGAPPDVDDSVMQPADQDTSAPQLSGINDAIASMSGSTQALANLGPISADDVVLVSLADLGASPDQQTVLMQGIDASAAANLQAALVNAVVTESGSLGGYNRSLADHLQLMGVDPSSVMAVNVDQDGTVTVYHQ